MTRLLTVFLSALAAVGCVSAQASPNAQTAVDKTREYFNEALVLRAQTDEIGTLSCVEYALNMGPYTKIVPTLERIKGILDAYKQIVNFQPPLNLNIPEEAAAGNNIVYFLAAATIEIGEAFDRMTKTGTANLCTVPVLGTKIKKALQDVKAVSRPFYLSLASFHPTEAQSIGGLLLSFESNIEAAIQAYSSPIPV
ncbi:uncharacterized protein QC761_106263 [Podospora bellae-mahoneyi]|uniref:Uncharacterized protein n=1 Tax=Podospora bellae-mahoneyi TaxID=2093777 RepID=A0ABR0FXC4_9PEZI|nr:hypothetical protein QC761_106263 [Podospora bellae-mahoneyi]